MDRGVPLMKEIYNNNNNDNNNNDNNNNKINKSCNGVMILVVGNMRKVIMILMFTF